jgi:hypothetical protein
MKLTRRGLFGLIGGGAVAAVLPKSGAELVLTPRDDGAGIDVDVQPIATSPQAADCLWLYPATAAEVAADVTPRNYFYPPGHRSRYTAAGWQRALDHDVAVIRVESAQ